MTKEKPFYTVVKSTSRHYGYSIKSSIPQSHILGPGNTFAWYKYKYAAQQRAHELNECEEKRR